MEKGFVDVLFKISLMTITLNIIRGRAHSVLFMQKVIIVLSEILLGNLFFKEITPIELMYCP